MYPDPRPSREGLAAYYPEADYYAYSGAPAHRLFSRGGLAAKVWYSLTRGILSARYGYPLGGWRGAARLTSRLPFLTARATHRLGNLLHPWRPHGTLLDVGCGAGRYLDLMRALGWERVVGVDISERAVANARAAGLEAYAGELHGISFPDDTFDAVTLSHTLEHVPAPVDLLQEVGRIAKPGGRLAIVVPNVDSVCARLFGSRWVGFEAPRHLVNFSPTALSSAIAAAGLQLESLTTSAEGAYRMTLFCMSRLLGDPHAVYTDHQHSFGYRRRVPAVATAAVEWGLCSARVAAGEKLLAVVRT